MKIIPISNNLIGKLVYFEKPVFELNKLLDFQEEFKIYLEDIISIKFSNPIVEPIDPFKVLSKEHPTLRFKYGIFPNKNFEYLDSIGMGFGEKGYFYDVYLKFDNNDKNLEIDKIISIVNEMDSISKIIENNMEVYYFMKPNKVNKIEVSNFMMYLEFKKPLDSILDIKISSKLENLAKASEVIIPNIENKINFNFRLEFYPEIFEEGLVNINPNDIIVKDRILKFSKDLSKKNKNQYAIRMRGLPIEGCLNFLKIIKDLID